MVKLGMVYYCLTNIIYILHVIMLSISTGVLFDIICLPNVVKAEEDSTLFHRNVSIWTYLDLYPSQCLVHVPDCNLQPMSTIG